MDDFAEADLLAGGITAINPDLFLASYLKRRSYAQVVDLFVSQQLNPPTTAAGFHSRVARQHPLLFRAHADLYDVEPQFSKSLGPRVLERGLPRP